MRNKELDGLRGLAALAVALGHCNTNATGMDAWGKSIHDMYSLPLSQAIGRFGHIIFPADAAVIVFFVLSGYVLWGSMVCRQINSLVTVFPYMISRFYRLLPVAVVSAIILAFIMPTTGEDVARNALLFSYTMNGVQWSLQVEIIASLFLFLTFLALQKQWICFVLLGVGLYCDRFFALYFLPFLLGAVLHYLPAKFFRLSSVSIAAYILLVTADFLLQRNIFSLNVRFIMAFVVVGAVIHQRFSFLKASVPQFLGKISYSFYLSHVAGTLLTKKLMVYLNLQSVSQFEAFLILVFFSVICILPVSWFIHIFIEKPGIKGGIEVVQSLSLWIEENTRRLSLKQKLAEDVIIK